MFNLLNLSPDLLDLILSHLHNTDVQSLKRTNSNLNFNNHCNCESKVLTEWTSELASIYGYLEVIKYLDSINAKFTTDAMNWGVRNNRLDIVKWLHENRNEGCSKVALYFAAMCGHLDLVIFLYENRNEGDITSAISCAVLNKQWDVAEWLENCL